MTRTVLAGLTLLALTQPLTAQNAPRAAQSAASAPRTATHEVTLDASILRGTLGYAHHVAPRALLGLEAGFGFPQLDLTLNPNDEQADFEEYLHIAGFVRLQPVPAVDLDAGLRASVADLWDCTASDCWPALFGGAYLQPMIGWRRLKFGMRLVGGTITDGREGTPQSRTSLLALDPLVVRGTIAW